MKNKIFIPAILICLTAVFAFNPIDRDENAQTDYYTPYCVDGDGWLNRKGCDGQVYSLDGSNQIGKRHEQATKGHRWDNKFCRTGG